LRRDTVPSQEYGTQRKLSDDRDKVLLIVRSTARLARDEPPAHTHTHTHTHMQADVSFQRTWHTYCRVSTIFTMKGNTVAIKVLLEIP